MKAILILALLPSLAWAQAARPREDQASCAWRGRLTPARTEVTLLTAPDGVPFAQAGDGRWPMGEVVLVRDHVERAWLRLEEDEVTLDAAIDPRQLNLYLKTPRQLTRVLSARPNALVQPREAHDHQLVVELPAPSRFRPLAPLLETLACRLVTLSPSPMLDEDERGRRVRLAAQNGLPVAAEPNGPSQGELRDSDPVNATLLEERAGWSRVRVSLHPYELVGWVRAGAVRSVPKESGLFGVLGGLGMSGRGPQPEGTRCDAELTLWAVGDGHEVVIGKLARNTLLSLGARGPLLTPVVLVNKTWLKPAKGWTFAVSSVGLQRCGL